MRDIKLRIQGDFRPMRALRGLVNLKIQRRGEHTEITLPTLAEYEMLVVN